MRSDEKEEMKNEKKDKRKKKKKKHKDNKIDQGLGHLLLILNGSHEY